MGLFNFLDIILDFLFGWTKMLPSVAGLFILSLVITLIITLIYKYTTDQKLMKSLRDKQKKMQEEIKKNRDNPKKMLKIQQDMMKDSTTMMKESFKSMIYTFIPIIILFGWMAANYSHTPANVNEQLTVDVYVRNAAGNITLILPEGINAENTNSGFVDGIAHFNITATKPGVYDLMFSYNGVQYAKTLAVGVNDNSKDTKLKASFTDFFYSPKEGALPSDGQVDRITINYKKLRPLEPINLFGWHPGWLGTYIIFSLILTIAIRKIMKVY